MLSNLSVIIELLATVLTTFHYSRGDTAMIRLLSIAILFSFVQLATAPAWAAGEPASMSKVEFDALMQKISNWGRWGDDDELGTLNLITPAKRKAAAALVQDGVTVSLALELNKKKDDVNANPFMHELSLA